MTPAGRCSLGGEYNARSADAAVELLQRVLDEYGSIRRLRGGDH